MAIADGYCTLLELKAWLGGKNGSADDNDLERAVEAASRSIDRYCARDFLDSGSATARSYVAVDPYTLEVDDFSTTSGLVVKTDTTGDGSFDTTWDASGSPADYQAAPLRPKSGWPFTRIEAIDDKAFPTSTRRAYVEVTAQWGWAAVPTDVEQACLILAARLFKRRETSSGVIGFDAIGATVRIGRNDPDVTDLLNPFRDLRSFG